MEQRIASIWEGFVSVVDFVRSRSLTFIGVTIFAFLASLFNFLFTA